MSPSGKNDLKALQGWQIALGSWDTEETEGMEKTWPSCEELVISYEHTFTIILNCSRKGLRCLKLGVICCPFCLMSSILRTIISSIVCPGV